ncbi:hypothetical protein E2320_014531 [Naja naja]|nr:hypothetical protein E2320_014531 [Naja naja]
MRRPDRGLGASRHALNSSTTDGSCFAVRQRILWRNQLQDFVKQAVIFPLRCPFYFISSGVWFLGSDFGLNRMRIFFAD